MHTLLGMGSSLNQTTGSAQSDDLKRCKLCGQATGVATFTLGKAHLFCCSACDFHYLDLLDPPPEEATAALTEQQQRYIENRLKGNARILAARLKLVQAFLPLDDQSCLDIGTGVGQFLQMLKDAGATPRGIEPSGLRREFARQHFGLNLSRHLPEEPYWQDQYGTFDLITLWDVLEHVNDPVATLRATFNLLKPGGLLFIETDNRDTASYRLSTWIYRLTKGGSSLFLPNFYRPAPYGHKQIFRPTQLYALAIRSGFELVAANPPQTATAGIPKPGYRPTGQITLVARKPS